MVKVGVISVNKNNNENKVEEEKYQNELLHVFFISTILNFNDGAYLA